MRALLAFPILLLAAGAAFAQASEPILFLAAREGRVEARNSRSLQLTGSIGVGHNVESISASPDGRRLYLAQEDPRMSGACCGLYALDLDTHNICAFGWHGMFAAPSPDGRFIFTQSGDRIGVFDAGLNPLFHSMKASGAYNLQPSPDGRWLLGITNSAGPWLDVFDLNSREPARRLSIPSGPATGVWAGSQFYIFSYGPPGTGQLWKVKPEDTRLAAAKQIHLPDLHGACGEPMPLMLAGAPGRLFLAEAFGFKLDRRHACPDVAPGIYEIDPASGQATAMARSVHVNRMLAGPDGRDLYVLQSTGSDQTGSARLLRIDGGTGRVVSGVALEPGEWSMALARVPPALVPRGYVRAGPSVCR